MRGNLSVPSHRAAPGAALLGRLFQAGEELLGVEILAAPVLLGDVERHRLDALIRGEALPALQAFTPAADRLPDLGVSGVDHLQVVVTAVRAAHGLRVYSYKRLRRNAGMLMSPRSSVPNSGRS